MTQLERRARLLERVAHASARLLDEQRARVDAPRGHRAARAALEPGLVEGLGGETGQRFRRQIRARPRGFATQPEERNPLEARAADAVGTKELEPALAETHRIALVGLGHGGDR